jgi:hypothetical protein
MLVRDFIATKLYGARLGYFAASNPIISPSAPLAFHEMLGQADYREAIANLFSRNPTKHWLTPNELFRPHYSNALARWIGLRRPRPASLFEIGGGNGTNALHVLDYLQLQAPDTYDAIAKYHLVEISQVLADKQRQVLSASSHANKVEVHHQDFLLWNSTVSEPCVVIALEVLDNLPHDKLLVSRRDGGWRQVLVRDDSREEVDELLVDEVAMRTAELFGDGLVRESSVHPMVWWPPSEMIKHLVTGRVRRQRELFERSNGEYQAVFVPSGCTQMLRVLRKHFPLHSLFVADFDSLPLGSVDDDKQPVGSLRGCVNSPIVSSMDETTGKRVDHPTYLVPTSADVFFQTDFALLSAAYQAEAGNAATGQVYKSSAFLRKYGNVALTQTRSGFNPMLEDFENTSCFVAERVV